MRPTLAGWEKSPTTQLLQFESRYRFFFNPIRYTSLGLAVCEAMMIGMPVIGLATTEMSAAIHNDLTGYVDTNIHTLIDSMKDLLTSPEKARLLSNGARRYAQEHFSIDRFSRDWDRVFTQL